MAWLEVVWHFHNMCGISLGVLPDKKCGKKRFALKSAIGNAALPLANISECARLFLNAVKQLEKEVNAQVIPGARKAYCKSCWTFGSRVRCAGISFRITDVPLQDVQEFVRVVRQLPAKNPLKSVFPVNLADGVVSNLYRLVFHIVKHQSWPSMIAAKWRTKKNSLLLGFSMLLGAIWTCVIWMFFWKLIQAMDPSLAKKKEHIITSRRRFHHSAMRRCKIPP